MRKLFICLLLFCFSFVGFAYEWDIDSWTLIISGSGEIPDFEYGDAPWINESKYINNVKIEEGITRIGNYAFAEMKRTFSIEIPSTVKSIGDYAFYCTPIESINIPDGVEKIGKCVFLGCTSLKSFSMADSVVSFGREAFYRCYKLSSVKLSKNLKKIEPLMFFCCDNLEKIVIPEGVREIRGCAFKSAGLFDVSIPKSVEVIAEGAFEGTYLKNVELPNESVVIETNGFPPNCHLSDNRIVEQEEVISDRFYP